MDDNKTRWSIHVEWAVVLITLIGGFYMIDSKIDNHSMHLDNKIMCLDNKIDQNIMHINNRMDQFMIEWKNEVKDFHGRLCAIEERNKK